MILNNMYRMSLFRLDVFDFKLNTNFYNKMKTKLFILIVLMLGLSAFNAYSQEKDGIGSGYKNLYDINTVETITGEIISVDKVYSDNNLTYGVHMALYSSEGLLSVHLGPSWFVDNQEIQLTSGDFVSVTGSRLTFNNNQIIIAKEVMKDNAVLLLRDDTGYPLWAAMPNR
jgi:hypothetical protein